MEPEQVRQFASEAGRRRRLRDNMRAKTGAQKPLRKVSDKRTPPSWGSGRGSKPRYGGSGGVAEVRYNNMSFAHPM